MKTTEGIIYDDKTDRLVCSYCSEFHQLKLPIGVGVLTSKLQAFWELHETCRPPAATFKERLRELAEKRGINLQED